MRPEDARKYAAEEIFNVHLYEWLANSTSDADLKETLQKFAHQERAHYEFWKRWFAGEALYPRWRLRWYKLLVKLLGVSFILRQLERKEHATIKAYQGIAPTLEAAQRDQLLRLIEDEEQHESAFLKAIQGQEPRLRYLGFIVLGLSDAIIEVTGVHAGFLGVSHRPLAAGIAGLIVGFAASISMASAAYLQAKQNPSVSAPLSALYTGLSYIAAVVLLALPYFFFRSMGAAFWGSVLLAILCILGFVYYSAVVFERPFRQEALESLSVLAATALLSYGFGELLRYFFPEALL